MANSKLLKEAIADAKAVRETAIANAKIALEEAFTPQLQSILSKKLESEMEDGDDVEDDEEVDEIDSSDIGDGENKEPSDDASDAHTELGPETEKKSTDVGDELEEGEKEDDENHEEDDEDSMSEADTDMEDDDDDDDELDLESIIKELEMEMDEDDDMEDDDMKDDDMEDDDMEDDDMEDDDMEDDDMEDDDMDEDGGVDFDAEDDDEIDLDEILREMGYGDDEEVDEANYDDDDDMEENSKVQAELSEAYSTIKELKGTINEVNLLNAKLLYSNRLFKNYNLSNEQKSKVVENLDRPTSVREVKLVYATLAESMDFSGTKKKTKNRVSEGASKPVASTKPSKEIISESNSMAGRFQKLANIKKNN